MSTEPMSATTSDLTLSLDNLLDRLFARASHRDLIRLATPRHDYFFWRRNGSRWMTPPAAIAGDRLAEVVTRNADTEIRLSPCWYSAPSVTALKALPVLWVAVPVASEPAPEHFRAWGVRLDLVSEALALERLRALKNPPNVIVHEGLRLVGLWTLDEPCDDLARGARVLEALAQRLDVDPHAATPHAGLVGLPGQPMPGVFPRREITATLVHTRRIAVTTLD